MKKLLSWVLLVALMLSVCNAGWSEELPPSDPPADSQTVTEPTAQPDPTPTNTPAPVETETPAPVETETPAPAETETPAPAETETPAPEETETPAPEETETPAPEETETPAPTETELPATEEPARIDYALSVRDNPLFEAGYVRVLGQAVDAAEQPGKEALCALERDAVVYLLSWEAQEGISYAQITFPTQDGEWHALYADAALLRPMDEAEVSAYVTEMSAPVFFVREDPALPLAPLPLAILARVDAPAPVALALRVEPLWEGAIAQTPGDAALLDARDQGGVSLRDALSGALSAQAEQIDVSGYAMGYEQAKSALQAFVDEQLSFFHVSGSWTAQLAEGVVSTLVPQYHMTAEQWAQNKADQAAAVAQLLSETPREDSTLGQVVALHDLFCGLYWVEEGSGQSAAYQLLAQGYGDSHAVALAMHAALQAANIPSAIVRSPAMGRAWNMVQLGGHWYHMDVAQDMSGSSGATVQYAYMLLSEGALRSREANHRDWWPVIAATDAAYDAFDFVSFGPLLEQPLALLQSGAFPEATPPPMFMLMATNSFEDLMVAGISAGASSIDVSACNLTTSQMFAKYQAMVNDHPEFFYLGSSYYYYTTQTGYVTSILPNYRYTGADRLAKINTFNAKTQAIISGMPSGLNDVGKALYLNDYMAINYQYDTSFNVYDAYGILVEEKGVCQAYSLLYRYLLRLCSVDSKIAVSQTMNHAWNVVRLNSGWYHVDVTWNDPVPNVPGYVAHEFFLLSDSAMLNDRYLDHFGWDINTGAVSAQYDNFFWTKITRPFSYGDGGWYYSRLVTGKTTQIVKWNAANNAHTVIHSFTGDWPDTMTSAGPGYAGVMVYGDRLLFGTRSGIFRIPLGGGVPEQLSASYSAGKYGYSLYRRGAKYYFAESTGAYNTRTERLLSTRMLGGATAQERQVLAFVERLYQVVLNRSSTDSDIEFWFEVLMTQRDSGAGVSAGFLLSQEFLDRRLSDSAFVEVLYLTCMNRPSDATGKAFWMGKLANGGTRAGAVKLFLESPEYTGICASYGILRGTLSLPDAADQNVDLTMFIYRLYAILLDRAPDKEGLNYWADKMLHHGVTGKEVAHGFVFSPEFQGKRLGNEAYVRYLYRALLGRQPEPEGLAFQVAEVIKKGRVDIYNNFVDSPEFREIMNSYGVH